MDLYNPANPLSPLNPSNPISPFYNMNNTDAGETHEVVEAESGPCNAQCQLDRQGEQAMVVIAALMLVVVVGAFVCTNLTRPKRRLDPLYRQP